MQIAQCHCCLVFTHLMYLWHTAVFFINTLLSGGKRIAPLVLEEVIRIPPCSLLHVNVVWESVFSICPWSVGSRKMGWSRLQMLLVGIAKHSPVILLIKRVAPCLPCCNRSVVSYADATGDMQWLQQAQRQQTALVRELLQELQCTHGESVEPGAAGQLSAGNLLD